MRRFICIVAFLVGLGLQGFSQLLFKGVIMDDDSVSAMPFVYVINKRTGNGNMSDNSGRFYLNVDPSDTLVFSFVGYVKLKLPVSRISKGPDVEVKIVMHRISYNLNTVTVSAFKMKPYEREHMEKVIKNSKMRTVNAIESPISALYQQFSKRGKEQRKLAKIFEEVFIEEQVQLKLNPEILRNLTGDDSIDYEAFRKYCFSLTNYYILNHEGYDLYYKVMECYYRWKEERR
ncbi:MAG: carboxypeptidase-like regulatory domain-containing protein [Bacteroidia bacterium]